VQIIAKLPPSWKGNRKKLQLNYEDFSLEKFQKHFESRRRRMIEKTLSPLVFHKANVVGAKGKKNMME
jgi:hypothetical protein